MLPLYGFSLSCRRSNILEGLQRLRLMTNRSAPPKIINHTTRTKQERIQQKFPVVNLSLIGKPGSGKGTYGALLAKSLDCSLVIVGDVLRDHVQNCTEIGQEISEFQREGRLADDILVAKALLSHLESMDMPIGEDGISPPALLSNSNETIKFGYILDGFPRTLPQAELMFPSPANDNDSKVQACNPNQSTISWPTQYQISFAVNIDVSDQICIDKMLGRRKCKVCNESFNVADVNTIDGFVMPPKLPLPHPCQKCDMELDWEKRLDDTQDIMKRRLEEFHNKSSPVAQFFEDRGKLAIFRPYRGLSDMPMLEDLVKQRARDYY